MSAKDLMASLKEKGYSEEQIERALGVLEKEPELRAKRQAYAEKRKNDPVFMDKQRSAYKRRNAKARLLMQKALEAGITVSDTEIDQYLEKA